MCSSQVSQTPSQLAQAASPRRVLTLAARTLSLMGITECQLRPPWVSAILRPTATTMEATLSSSSTSSRHCRGRGPKRTITIHSTTSPILSRRHIKAADSGALMPNPFSMTKSPTYTQGQLTNKGDPPTQGASDRLSNLSSGQQGTQAQTILLQAKTTLSRSWKLLEATSNYSRLGCRVKRSRATALTPRTSSMKGRGSLTSMSPLVILRGKPCALQAVVPASNKSTKTRTSERPLTLHRWTLMSSRLTI